MPPVWQTCNEVSGNDGMTTSLHFIPFFGTFSSLTGLPYKRSKQNNFDLWNGLKQQFLQAIIFWTLLSSFFEHFCQSLPKGSTYSMFTYIYHQNQPNVGKYTMHGSYGKTNTWLSIHVTFLHLLWWSALPAPLKMLGCTGKPEIFFGKFCSWWFI